MNGTRTGSSKKILAVILVLGMTVIITPRLCLGQNVFVEMDGITGEATESAHKGWIEAFGFADGITLPAAATGGALAVARTRPPRGTAAFDTIKIMKTIDKASIPLRRKAAEGGVIKNATIDVTRKKDGKIFLQITLENVTVAEISSALDPSADAALETMSLNFQRIKYVYTEYDSAGKPKGSVELRWDTVANKIY